MEKESFSSYQLHVPRTEISVSFLNYYFKYIIIVQVNVQALCKIFKQSVHKGDTVSMQINEIDGPLVISIASPNLTREIK